MNSMMKTYVVEPREHTSVEFDPIMLHGSITEACLTVRSYEGEAHLTAQHVCKAVIAWLAGRTEVTRRDIRRVATNALTVYHPEAAYLYENERNII